MGYTPLSAANQLRLMAHASRWLAAEGIGPEELGTERVGEFLKARRSAGYTGWLSNRGLSPMVSYLRRLGAAPSAVEQAPVTPLDVLLKDYRDYLVRERGLVAATVQQYTKEARLFLSGWSDPEEFDPGGLDAGDVTAFVVQECPRRSVGGAKYLVTSLRSLLRYLHLTGWIDTPLASAVPAVAGWRLSGLPKGLEPDQLECLLDLQRFTADDVRASLVLIQPRLGGVVPAIAGIFARIHQVGTYLASTYLGTYLVPSPWVRRSSASRQPQRNSQHQPSARASLC